MIGVDDYLIKPVKPRLLLAKVKSFLRKKETFAQQDNAIIKHGSLQIDMPQRLVLLTI
ncbi:MAG: response regulator transcription factor [Oceanospirillaceae bacterium]|nr:response regulator transcription factor [Oceanospirillaceae bacterium]